MNESTKTKKALRGSLLALFLCIVLLIGTTFAWFTDTASTGVNKIQSGNLKVDIIGENSKDHVEKLNFKKTAGEENEAILWEPGCRYLTEGFRIANKGNLALKWKAEINKDNITDGKVSADAKEGKSLLDVIDFYVVKSTDENAEAVAIEDFIGNLDKTKTSDVYYIKGVMQTTAGNDYQDLTLEGITITVYATQDTVESDSFDNQYDKDAGYTYSTSTVKDMNTALKNAKDGDTIKVAANLDPTGTFVADNKKVTLDMNGKTLANSDTIWKDNEDPNNWSLVSAQNGSNLTIDGNGTFKAKENDCYAVDVQDGSSVVIKNGTFVGNIHAVYVLNGTAIIEGGTYSVQQKYSDPVKADGFVLNCYDANRANGTAKIIVKGGTFINFNPADCWAEGEHTNFLASGYTVKYEVKGDDTYYTVVKAN